MDKASVIRVVIGVLGLIKLFLEPYGYEIPQELIDAIANVIAVVAIAWVGWKNNYLSKKGKKQKEVLQKYDLK